MQSQHFTLLVPSSHLSSDLPEPDVLVSPDRSQELLQGRGDDAGLSSSALLQAVLEIRVARHHQRESTRPPTLPTTPASRLGGRPGRPKHPAPCGVPCV